MSDHRLAYSNYLSNRITKRALAAAAIVSFCGLSLQAQADDGVRYSIDTPSGKMMCLWKNNTYSDCLSEADYAAKLSATESAAAVQTTQSGAQTTQSGATQQVVSAQSKQADDDDDIDIIIVNNDAASNDAASNDAASNDAVNSSNASSNNDAASSTDNTPDAFVDGFNDDDNASSSYEDSANDNYNYNDSGDDNDQNGSYNDAGVSSNSDISSGVSAYSPPANSNAPYSYESDVSLLDDFGFYFGLHAGWAAFFCDSSCSDDCSDYINAVALGLDIGTRFQYISLSLDNDFTLLIQDDDTDLIYSGTFNLKGHLPITDNFWLTFGAGIGFSLAHKSYIPLVDSAFDDEETVGAAFSAKATIRFEYVFDGGFTLGAQVHWLPIFTADYFSHIAGISLNIGFY